MMVQFASIAGLSNASLQLKTLIYSRIQLGVYGTLPMDMARVLSYTVSQRAPSAQELYSYGIHESTATFAVGNSNLSKEISHNLELNLQKTMGAVSGKVNVYANKFNNYIYGYYY
jgi:outer membrane cobalamin receptor